MPSLWDVLPGGKWPQRSLSCTFPGPHVLSGPGVCYLSPGGAHCLTQTPLPNATSQVSGLTHLNTWSSSKVLCPARRSCRLTGWWAIQCDHSHVHESPVWARERMTVLALVPSIGGPQQPTASGDLNQGPCGGSRALVLSVVHTQEHPGRCHPASGQRFWRPVDRARSVSPLRPWLGRRGAGGGAGSRVQSMCSRAKRLHVVILQFVFDLRGVWNVLRQGFSWFELD